jgi:SsrA-binding protein
MKIITTNRKAFHEYEILDKFEAGIQLTGSEVKSIRAGQVNLKDAYIDIRNQEAYLLNSHISPYEKSSFENHEPERERKLLLHKQELQKMDKKVKTRGVTIIPLNMHFNPKGLVKLEIAIAKGKRVHEKKQKIKERDIKREIDRELKHFK